MDPSDTAKADEIITAKNVDLSSCDRELIQYLGHQDPTTSHMLRSILAVEEEHADELSDLLVGQTTRST